MKTTNIFMKQSSIKKRFLVFFTLLVTISLAVKFLYYL